MDISFVEIEPTNKCNNVCAFCRPGMTRPYSFLKLERFKEVIDELARYDYRGWISFAGLGEPILHPDIMEMLSYRVQVLSEAQVVFYTNGIEFDDPGLFEYMDGLVDFILYNNYSDLVGRAMARNYQLAEFKPPVHTIDHAGGQYAFYNDRAGQPELSRFKRSPLGNPCSNFKHRLFLAAEGCWVTCCQDMKQARKWWGSIQELLADPGYQELRSRLEVSRVGVPLCENCGVEMGTIYHPPIGFPDRLV